MGVVKLQQGVALEVKRKVSDTLASIQKYRHSRTLQHTATHCNTLERTVSDSLAIIKTQRCSRTLQHTARRCNTLQHTATHCLRHAAIIKTQRRSRTHCNTLQHTATHCNTLSLTHWSASRRSVALASVRCVRLVGEAHAALKSVLQCVAVRCSVLQRVAECQRQALDL